MQDTARITRGDGTPVTDPETGAVTTTPNVVYEGPVQISTYEAQEARSNVGGAAIVTVQRYILKVPVGAYQPSTNDVAVILTAAHDPYLVGRRFDVVALLHKTMATAYRLGVEDRGRADD